MQAYIRINLLIAQSLIQSGQPAQARKRLCDAMGKAKSAGNGQMVCWIMNAIKATHAIERTAR